MDGGWDVPQSLKYLHQNLSKWDGIVFQSFERMLYRIEPSPVLSTIEYDRGDTGQQDLTSSNANASTFQTGRIKELNVVFSLRLCASWLNERRQVAN